MEQEKLDDLIKQRKNKYFRDYYKKNKDTVIETQRRYWERKIKQEQDNEKQTFQRKEQCSIYGNCRKANTANSTFNMCVRYKSIY